MDIADAPIETCEFGIQASVETREFGVQAEPEVQWEGTTDIGGTDNNCIMKISKLEDFIRLSTSHAAQCGKQLVLIERKMNCGTYMEQRWKCPCCGKELSLENCNMVRSETVAQGAAYSRSQPDFNLRLVAGAELTGINLQKLQEFMSGFFGIQLPTSTNLRIQQTKARESIKQTYHVRKEENVEEHVAAVRAAEKYRGDLVWEDENGVEHHTSTGDISFDGAGCTRSFNNRHRGKQTAFVVNSMTTKKPLALVVSQASILVCSLHGIHCYNVSAYDLTLFLSD